MSRQSSALGEERNVAQHLRRERERRGWSYEAMAQELRGAGCPLPASAIFKIEKGDPPRRITLTEFLAIARVLEIETDRLLRPPDEPDAREIADLLTSLRRQAQTLRPLLDDWIETSDNLFRLVGRDATTWSQLAPELEEIGMRIRGAGRTGDWILRAESPEVPGAGAGPTDQRLEG